MGLTTRRTGGTTCDESSGAHGRIVLTVLRGEVTIAEAARREAVSQTSIANWRDQFLDGGQQAVAAGGPTKPTTREQRWTPSTVRSAEPTMRTRDEVGPPRRFVGEPDDLVLTVHSRRRLAERVGERVVCNGLQGWCRRDVG